MLSYAALDVSPSPARGDDRGVEKKEKKKLPVSQKH